MSEKYYMSVRRHSASTLYTAVGIPIELSIEMGLTPGSVVSLEQKDDDTIEIKIIQRKEIPNAQGLPTSEGVPTPDEMGRY